MIKIKYIDKLQIIYIYIYIQVCLRTIYHVGPPPPLYMYTKVNTFALNRLPFAIQAARKFRADVSYMETLGIQSPFENGNGS